MTPASLVSDSLPGAPGDPLAGLRDYHLPEAVTWWPPAPGWWLLLAVLGVVVVWWLVRRGRCRAAARQALRELAQLRGAPSTRADAAALVRGLSRLLRRYAMVAFPGHPVAALTGDRWLAFLDDHGGGGRFRHGPGRHLVEAPYRRAVEVPVADLADLVHQWILHNRVVCR